MLSPSTGYNLVSILTILVKQFFAKNRLMFLKFYVNFSIYSKGGGEFQKPWDGLMFYFRPFVFPEIVMHI